MARHLRVKFPGAIYHVTVRMLGNWKREGNLLFEDNEDRERFLDRMAERVEQFNVRLYLFVLMANHFHLVFETPGGNCSKFMQALSTAYTVYFNLRHGRHGHLLDGRYKARLVESPTSSGRRWSSEYLKALSRYVHLNPVRTGAMKSRPIGERIRYLRQYPWSSYPGYIQQRRGLNFIDYGPVLAEMGQGRKEQSRRYRAFVEAGLVGDDEEFREALKASPRCIGDDRFRAWVDDLYQDLTAGRRRPEDVAFRRITEPLPAETVLEIVGEELNVGREAFLARRRNSFLRGAAAHFLCRYAGLTQREVATVLRVGSGAAISYQMHKLGEQLPNDRRLGRLVEGVNLRLAAMQKTAAAKNE
jgi:putative transposase